MAKHAVAFARSDGFNAGRWMELNGMLSWCGNRRGVGVGGTDFGKLLILLLLDESRIDKRASSETAFNE